MSNAQPNQNRPAQSMPASNKPATTDKVGSNVRKDEPTAKTGGMKDEGGATANSKTSDMKSSKA